MLERNQKQPLESQLVKGDSGGFYAKKSSTSTAVSGTMHLLVIGVDYDDCPATYSASQIQSLVFGSSNSVADYYNDVSYSAVTISPATESSGTSNDGFIGWLRLSGNHPNPGSYINDQIAADAILAADPYIDYSTYDTDGDGVVEPTELSIVIIVAGYEAAYSNNSPSVWAHKYGRRAYYADGKRIDEYAEFGEKHGDHLATFGIIAHELGHLMFSLPDLYDTSNSAQGIGYFDLMASGSWGAASGAYSGSSPTHLSAWSKEYLSWGIVNTVSSSQTISLPKADGNKASIFRINTSADSNQYFLIENRVFSGYDKGFQNQTGLSGHGGLVIYHIDRLKTEGTALKYNEVNNGYDKGVDVEEANEGILAYPMLDTYDGPLADTNMFFFSGNNTSFTDTTTPGSRLYDGTYANISITDISSYGDTMTASFNPSTTPPVPKVKTWFETDLASDSATLNGTVTAYGLETTVWFEYGTASGTYGSKTSTQTISETGDTSVSASISGLSPGVTYYYRLATQNSAGTVYGREYSLTFLERLCRNRSCKTVLP